jgi:hypothetical protein
MKRNKFITLLLMLLLTVSCGEELLTKGTITETDSGANIQNFSMNTCAQMHFEKPPVDILFVVDNSGSTLMESFQQIKGEISNTINNISDEFDYHIYVAPLLSLQGDSINGYPLIINNPDSLPSIATVNLVSPENLQFFASTTGNNQEYGFQRAKSIIDANRSNGIFRDNANTIVVMISNGDDTQAYIDIGGNKIFDSGTFNTIKNSLLSFSEKYADANSVSNPMNAENFRFISLVAHSNCNGFKKGTLYQRMSNEIYDYMENSDDPYSKDSRDLCSGNYSTLFAAVNNSIRATVVGHSYDHWLISTAQASQIQEDDITVTKILANGSQVSVPQSATDGFEYLGYKTNHNTRYLPDVGEPVTGLVIKLNGSARVSYTETGAECIIAKTRTPTEYFGYIALSSQPDLSTVQVVVRGQSFPQNGTNGWSYIGYLDTQNIKVPGPTNASTQPPLNRTGYFLKLNGDAIYTNGETVQVNYKPASL